MDSQEAASKWLYDLMKDRIPLTSLLGTPPTGLAANLFEGTVPQDAPFKYVQWSLIPGVQDELYGDGSIAIAYNTYLVKVVGDTNDGKGVNAVVREVFEALHNAVNTSYNGYHMNCLRQEGSNIPIFDDKQYRQAGGRYLVTARPLIELP